MGFFLSVKPEKLEIMPYGISIAFRTMPKDYNKKIGLGNLLEIKKILVAIAGPLTNFTIMIIVQNMNLDIFKELIIIYSNFLLFIFNLLPIYPLDGGRILKSILYIMFGKRKAEQYINNISFIALLLITLFGSVLIYIVKNIAIFIIILALWGMFIKEDLMYRRKNKIYKMIEKGIEIN